MKFRLSEQPDALSVLLEGIEAFLLERGVPPTGLYVANLCVEELLVNIVNHGYGGKPVADVEVDVEVSPQTLLIEISDGAAPFDPTKDAAAPDLEADLDARPIGGLGVHLVKQLTDEMSYRRADGRNQVRLIKRLAPEA
jgi:anti-sigma regulatory factor (Ser/Thr protein kinase)